MSIVVLVLQALSDGAARNAAIVRAVTQCSREHLTNMVRLGLIEFLDESGDGTICICPQGAAYLAASCNP